MKIIFMGTPLFAVPSLHKLIENKEEILAVVTKKDMAAGRGYKLKSSPIKEVANKANLLLLQPEKIKNKEFIKKIKNINPELIIVVAFSILPKEILSIPKFGVVNVHPSLLPKYRGPAPINWAIINGEKETGVTTIFLNEKIDAGEIILQQKVKIEHNDTYSTLYKKLSEYGANLLFETIKLIKENKVKTFLQNEIDVSFAPAIIKSQCFIDWSKSANEIYNFVRGLNPHTFTFWNKKKLKILEVEIYSKEFSNKKIGEVISIEKNKGIIINTGTGQILIKELQLENHKKMVAKEFLNGYKIKIGEILGK